MGHTPKPAPPKGTHRKRDEGWDRVGAAAEVAGIVGPIGYFTARLVGGGPPVPVRIWLDEPADPETGEPLDRPVVVRAAVAGIERHPHDAWELKKRRAITAADYAFRMAVIAWAERNAPGTPEANLGKRIDFGRLPPLLDLKP